MSLGKEAKEAAASKNWERGFTSISLNCLKYAPQSHQDQGISYLVGPSQLLEPTLDTTAATPHVSLTQLISIKRKLHSLQIVDVWHIMHHTVKVYTCYSTTHATYSRLDYLLVFHCTLDWHPQTSFDSQLWSDHSAIYFSLTLSATHKLYSTWKVNENAVPQARFSFTALRLSSRQGNDLTMKLPIFWPSLWIGEVETG